MDTRFRRWLLFAALAAITVATDAPRINAAPPTASSVLSRLPLAFANSNAGAGDGFIARTHGFTLRLTSGGAVFSTESPSPSRVEMRFPGGSTKTLRAGDRLPGVANYLIGNDPKAWSFGVATYRALRYDNVWEGIDVVFHGIGNEVEYDFEVAPHVDHTRIEVEFTGADQLAIDNAGNLVVTMGAVQQIQRAPRIIQDPNGARTTLPGRFVLRDGHRIGFEIDGRNPAMELLIDPEVAYLSPLFGGSAIDNVFSLAVGDDGRVTIAGYTASLDFPGMTPSSEQPINHSAGPFHFAGVVARLSADGSTLEWATYLSGSQGTDTKIWDVGVDAAGFTYVCGTTDSADFPTTPNANDRTYGGNYDGITAVLTPNGANLVYSSFLGGQYAEFMFGCSPFRDSRAGNGGGRGRMLFAATGYTNSPDFPLLNAPAVYDGSLDPVVSLIDPTDGALVYSTRIPGGPRDEWPMSLAVAGDSIAIVGVTYSTPRVPVPVWHHAIENGRGVALLSASGPFWVNPPGYGNGWNQVLSKAFTLPAGPSSATIVARWGTEEAFDFLRFQISADNGASFTTLVDRDGFSNGFETLTADLSAYSGRPVILRFDFFSDLSVSDQDGGIDTNGSAVDSIAVTGHAIDTFETGLDGWVPEELVERMPSDVQYGPLGGLTDLFVAVVKPFAQSMRVATFGGLGFESDQAADITIAADGSVVAVGTTASATFPTTPGAYQPTRNGLAGDIVIAKFTSDLALAAATYLGGTVSEFANGVAADSNGRVIVSGFSTSPNFPLREPLSIGPPFGSAGDRDYVLSILSPDLTQLVHSSKFGTAGRELGGEVTVGPDGFIYAVGRTGPSQESFVVKVRP